MRQNPKLRKIH